MQNDLGLWAGGFADVVDNYKIPLVHIEHQYASLGPIPEVAQLEQIPVIIDHDGNYYIRKHGYFLFGDVLFVSVCCLIFVCFSDSLLFGAFEFGEDVCVREDWYNKLSRNEGSFHFLFSAANLVFGYGSSMVCFFVCRFNVDTLIALVCNGDITGRNGNEMCKCLMKNVSEVAVSSHFERVAEGFGYAKRRLPCVTNAGVDASAGVFCCTPDGYPLMGPLLNHPNFWMATGFLYELLTNCCFDVP